ncbi:MAG: TRAP transporter fused permease subunit [Bacillota bacterium]
MTNTPSPLPQAKMNLIHITQRHLSLDNLKWILSIALSLMVILSVSIWTISPYSQRVLFLMLSMILVFLGAPITTNKNKRVIRLSVDFFLICLTIASCLYLYLDEVALMNRIGAPTTMDIIAGLVIIVLVLEATRRTIGWSLVLVALIFLLYAFGGPYFPGILSHHGPSLGRLVTQLVLSLNGIFGVAIRVMIWFVFLFILFGMFLEKAGGIQFFTDFARSLVGRATGGQGKLAVLVSALMGMISGTAVANVATTGSFTIPLMKKSGYRPDEFVGGVEAAASTGGQLLPPVMGATAFVMADFIGVSYVQVMKVAIIPALLYFLTIGVSVHFQAVRLGIKGDVGVGPGFFNILKRQGYFFFPVIVLTWILLSGYSATYSALFAIGTILVISIFNKNIKVTVSWFLDILADGAKRALSICAAVACAGIVIGVVLMTGLGLKLAGVIIDYAAGNIFILLVLSAMASLVLGMGLPSVVCYILLATLVGPALAQLGVEPILGHLFLFYFGMLAMVTPPIAFAAFAGAAIAGGKPMQTAIWSAKLALPGFVIPFVWVYNPAMVLIGPLWDTIFTILVAIVGIVAIGAASVGYFKTRLDYINRLAFLIGGIMVLFGTVHFWALVLGVLILSLAGVTIFVKTRKVLQEGGIM